MENSSSQNNKRDFSSEWFQLLVDSALDGVVTMDSGGRIIAFNPAAEKMFGYRKDEVIGHPVSKKLIPPNLRKAHESGLAHLLSGGEGKIIGQRIEVAAMRADGITFPAELEVVSVSPRKSPVFCAYIRDISEWKDLVEERLQFSLRMKMTLLQTILAFSKAVEIRDPYTAGHQRRVAHLSAAMAEAMGLPEEQIEGVFFGALIHDIGKIAVPAEILSRPGKLMVEDVEYIHIHCRKGHEILESVDFPWPVAEIALQHHEHLDGSGYPQGLKKKEILLEARIICVADVVEALTSHRPYRPARPLGETLASVAERAGQWYDQNAVAACVALFNEGFQINAAQLDELAWLAAAP